MLNRHRAASVLRRSLSWWVAAPAVVALALVPHRVALLAQEPNPLEGLEIPATLEAGSQLTIESSDAMKRINEALGPRFFQQYGNTEVAVNYSNSETAIQALIDGRVDLAAVGRGLTPEEQQAGLQQVPVARHKIAIIISPENPFDGTLTIDQFAQIFRGEITNWSEVGGPDAPIELIDRPADSDTRQAFLSYPVFQAAPFEAAPNATTLAEDSTAALLEDIGPNSIGYAIANQVIANPAVKVVPMHDTLPDDERYPFSQPLAYVYRAEEPAPAALAYLGYAVNPDNEAVIAEAQAAAAQEEAAAVQGSVDADGAATPENSATANSTLEDPAAGEPTSPETVATEPAAPITTGTDGVVAPNRSLPWWPWILSLPILGGLLWWLLRGSAPAAAPLVVATVAAVADEPTRRIILTPRDCRDAYAYWELPESEVAALQRQHYSLGLKLHDVTDIANVDQQAPHSSQLVPCETVSVGDHHLPIALDNRDYLVELGYLDEAQSWHALARSAPVRVPACVAPAVASADLGSVTKTGAAGTVATGAIAAGTAAAGPLLSDVVAADAVAADAVTESPIPQPMEVARVVLTPRDCRDAYAYWEIPPTQVTELQSDSRSLKLRLYDVTELPGSFSASPNSLQEFTADLVSQGDLPIPIAIDDRDYLVELGYTNGAGQWQTLAKSDLVRVPACLDESTGNGSRPQADFTRIADIPSADVPRADVPSADVLVTDAPSADVPITDVPSADMSIADAPITGVPSADVPITDTDVPSADVAVAAASLGLGAALSEPAPEPSPIPAADPAVLQSAETEAETVTESKIILVPRSAESAYAYWEVATADKDALKAEGGRVLALRIHDATHLELDHQPAHRTQEYLLQDTDQDKHVSIPSPDRDYVAELGYLTDSGDWLMLMRSHHVRLP